MQQELVLIEPDVPNQLALLQSLASFSDPGTVLEVVQLQGGGIQELTDAILDHPGLSAIHIISHGTAGSLDFGENSLDESTLTGDVADIRSWAKSLRPGADIFLYGCNFARDAEGKSIANEIHVLTGAEVAANTSLTGAAALGGDWNLNYATGPIAARTLDLPNWHYTLGASQAGSGLPAVVTSSVDLVSEDNAVVLLNSLTGAVIATYSTGLANDGLTFSSDGSFLVADYYNDTIDHYSASGTLIASFPTADTPQGLFIGPNGNLFITTSQSRVDEYTQAGASLGSFIATGSGGLSNAKAIVWGPNGDAYVSSYYNSEVLCYNGTTGAFIGVFATGSGGFEDMAFGPDGNLYVASYGDDAVYEYNGTAGASLGTFASGIADAYGLEFDPDGNLDVTSRSTGTIETFSPTGVFLANLATGLTNPSCMSSSTILTTSEAGTSTSVGFELNSKPLAPVTLELTNTNPALGKLSQSTLTFTPANWDIAQSITVTGLDNHAVGGPQSYQIDGTTSSSDSAYNDLSMNPISIDNESTDAPTFTSLSSSGTPTTYGQTVTFDATVSDSISTTPTGSITFWDGWHVLATVPLSSGAAVYTTQSLSVGSHLILAYYNAGLGLGDSASDLIAQSVQPATLTVTASDATKIYGQSNPALEDTITGFVNGDTSNIVTGSASLSTTATQFSGVGNYPITPSLGTLAAANYTFVFASGTLSVTPATLTVAANSLNSTYGQQLPALIDSITGFVNGDPQSVVSGTPILSTTASSAGRVGAYPITVGQGTLSATNYQFAFVDGILDITPATLTITVANANKVYGQANPNLTYTITGFVNGDSFSALTGSPTLDTSASEGSGVGNYAISVGSGSLQAANYTFAYVNGTLTVSPATLVVRANDMSKVSGQANPVFMDSITGFVNGDTTQVVRGAPSFASTATKSSPVGSYPITVSRGTLSAVNYSFGFANGLLTVTPSKSSLPSKSGLPSAATHSDFGVTTLAGSSIVTTVATSQNTSATVSALATVMSSESGTSRSSGTSQGNGGQNKGVRFLRNSDSTDTGRVTVNDGSFLNNRSSPGLVGSQTQTPSLKTYAVPAPVETITGREGPKLVVPIIRSPLSEMGLPTNAAIPVDAAAVESVIEQFQHSVKEMQASVDEEAITNTLVVTSGIAVAGSVLLNTRAVYWFLSALLARPAIWRRFDPLEVIYAWEREQTQPGKQPSFHDSQESLQSMVQ